MAALHVTKDNFQKEVLESTVPVLVDFWAEWCGPCQMMLPVIDELAGETKDAKICKVNVDDQKELAKEYRVLSIPTFLAFQDGKKVASAVGAKSKQELLDMLKV